MGKLCNLMEKTVLEAEEFENLKNDSIVKSVKEIEWSITQNWSDLNYRQYFIQFIDDSETFITVILKPTSKE